MRQVDIAALRKAVQEGRYLISRHAKQRAGQRSVSMNEIKGIVVAGDLIEQYPKAQPFPKALFMAEVRGEPVYVSCAFDGRFAHIVTVHRYDPNLWIDPWTRRRE